MRRAVVSLAIVLAGVWLSVPAALARDLTFEERVKAQKAIEQVYWSHRTWPKENPQPKPPLPEVMSDDAIRAKVEGYLRKTAALEAYWSQPIRADQLQAELDRMAKQTHSPEVLQELFAALGNDPFLIAETLARASLVDRLIRNYYDFDVRIHGDLERRAQTAVASIDDVAAMQVAGGQYREVVWRLEPRAPAPGAAEIGPAELRVDSSGWQELSRTLSEMPAARSVAADETIDGQNTITPMPLSLRDETGAFVASVVLERGPDFARLAIISWPKTPFSTWWTALAASFSDTIVPPSPSYALPELAASGCADDTWAAIGGQPDPRTGQMAVWTGVEMIAWGGSYLRSGGRYNPATDSWAPMPTVGAPEGCAGQVGVWTGTELVIWGGRDTRGELRADGGRYDPITDRWTPMSSVGAPQPRTSATAVWTGSVMVIWGGVQVDEQYNYHYFDTGGRYDPVADTWTATSTTGVPSGRYGHTAIWTGTEMVLWGGYGAQGYLGTGARYDPSSDRWTQTAIASAPSARWLHTAIWTGTEMIVWGGIGNDGDFASGGRYDPLSGTWTPTPISGAPTARRKPQAVWTGTEMIVWGGYANESVGTGGRFNPSAGTWTAMESAGAPTPRSGHSMVWTGREAIVWGGFGGEELQDRGGRYDPALDRWLPVSTGGRPEPTQQHTAVWTGVEMIVWGGVGGDAWFVETGGVYDPATDTWHSTSDSGTPSGRIGHTAVWTGEEMVVWGGYVYGSQLGDGGRYDQTTDTWATISSIGAPSERSGHTAIWTGRLMVVWGGWGTSDLLNTGGRYDPVADRWEATFLHGAPSQRYNHAAVWTGTEMVVWGGRGTYDYPNTGGRYDPVADTWNSLPTTGAPPPRQSPTAVWTGEDMIVWGGEFDSGYLGSGGRFRPSTGEWGPVSVIGAPSARNYHSAVWNGNAMIIWGGLSDAGFESSGARYDPSTDLWSPTSTAESPLSRFLHTAVWTGREMIVWGGSNYSTLSSGGRYRACPPNSPPVSDAGADQTVECTGNLQATATLDGSANTDPDSTPGTNDDIVRFDWSESGSSLASGMIVSVPFQLGTHDVTLTVTDRAGATASDGTIVTVLDTTPPTISCPAAVVAECQSAGRADVSLSPATASDLCHGTAAITNNRTSGGPDASGSYPLGTTMVTFTATDGSGNHASCQTMVTVQDTTQPTVTAVASPNVLWPPNHKMSTVNTTVVATDACDPSPSIVLLSVTSSEPDDAPGNGDGNTTNDIQDASLGTPDFQILLRAERDGNGSGRTYTITYQASDHSGNAAVASAQVAVPHDMGQGVEPLNLVMDDARSTTVIWGSVEGALHYDVIRGDLANLRIDGSNIDLGQVACIAQDTTATTTTGYEDTAIPEPGQVFFYAVQYNDGTHDSSYGSESAGRARVVLPGSGDCQ